MRRAIADLPLHGGKCPPWLFERMKTLGGLIMEAIVEFFGEEEILCRISDPVFFQSLGCLLGFDWHSSGLTTTLCGALKEGVRGKEKDLRLFICGGKGATSRKTPEEICLHAQKHALPFAGQMVYRSRMSAKVDNSALQDGYNLYHHTFFFTFSGKWAVVQQGMNPDTKYARRYHWWGEGVKDLVCEPHQGIWGEKKEREVLNLVARESTDCREGIVKLAQEKPEKLKEEMTLIPRLSLPSRHFIKEEDFNLGRIDKTLHMIYEEKPQNFENLLALRGVGPKTLRALALTTEVVMGASPSFTDPVSFSFAHGGKDGIPFPVDRETYQETIEFFTQVVQRSRASSIDKRKMYEQLKLLTI